MRHVDHRLGMMTDIWAHCQSSTSTRPIGSFCKGQTYLAPVVTDRAWSLEVAPRAKRRVSQPV